MDELEPIRAEIDAIDGQMVALFEARMRLTGRVGEYKRARGLPVLDGRREQAVLEGKRALLKDPALADAVTELYGGILAASRRQQQTILGQRPPTLCQFIEAVRLPLTDPTVLYQGEPGAYTEEAAILFFGESCRRTHCATWDAAFTALSSGAADYAVLPIENSSSGGISAVYDLLAQHGAYIVGEQTVGVEHCLMAPKGATLAGIRTVYSHEQGLLQSGAFLQQHDWACVPRLNTAESAKFVAEQGDSTCAAIGSLRAAQIYGLTVLAEKINYNVNNITRFVVVAKAPELRDGSDKVSALVTLPHQSGTLCRLMTVFAAHGLNMLKLESRPIVGRSWEYMFFLDFSGALTAPGMDAVLTELTEAATQVRILGNYPTGVEA